ncbi:hypothetical protein ABZ832_15385 [Streptantibioticus parmotrematis]
MSATRRAVAWVPAAEQRGEGGMVAAFQVQNRVFKGDPFYVEV